MERLTAALCERLTETMRAPLADSVVHAARRTLLNVVGTAIGASRHPSIDIVLAHAAVHGGDARFPVLGRNERTDMLHAALAIGQAAHVDDFDDTHLETVIHPGAATLAATAVAAVEHRPSGRDVLAAFALGCEAQLRIGAAMSPSHYDAGWHITGTCGVIGAAAAAGLLRGLDPVELEHALSIASSQTLGLRDSFGTMTKAFHPGKAAANGLLAVELAAAGMTAAAGVLEHPHGMLSVLADEVDTARITARWGAHWELEKNTFKPYPCGIVIHPIIDAAIELHDVIDDIATIDEVVVVCNPLVVDLTGNADPADGLEARFSAIHGAAAGLIEGAAGLAQYDDARVRSDDMVALRAKIRLAPDAAVPRDAATIDVHTAGAVISRHVAHARGSLDRPLSDADLAAKVTALVEPVLAGQADLIIETVSSLDHAPTIDGLLAACTGGRP